MRGPIYCVRDVKAREGFEFGDLISAVIFEMIPYHVIIRDYETKPFHASVFSRDPEDAAVAASLFSNREVSLSEVIVIPDGVVPA